jgi:hypothetical protein
LAERYCYGHRTGNANTVRERHPVVTCQAYARSA